MRTLQAIVLFMSLTPFADATILPDNDLQIPVSDKNEGLTRREYDAVIDKVEAIYGPIINELGKKLVIKRLWDDPSVNAGTLRRKDEWIINLYGGYPRHPFITSDGYTLVLCHELGHHLGGPPKKKFESKKGWPSVEGQSDYYATSKCLRKIFEDSENLEMSKIENYPEKVTETCSRELSTEEDLAFCKRALNASLSVSAVSAYIRRKEVPELDLKDTNVVKETYEAHPEPQCRLDTYLAGTLSGDRPLCWYAPK